MNSLGFDINTGTPNNFIYLFIYLRRITLCFSYSMLKMNIESFFIKQLVD